MSLESFVLGLPIWVLSQTVPHSSQNDSLEPRVLRTLTIDVTLENSKSPVIATDCTRNLSLHFASAGGSSFIACSKTMAQN